MIQSLLAAAWSPSAGGLHVLENFGRLSVAKPGGRTVEELCFPTSPTCHAR